MGLEILDPTNQQTFGTWPKSSGNGPPRGCALLECNAMFFN